MTYHCDFSDNWWYDIEVLAIPDGEDWGNHTLLEMLHKARTSAVERRKLISKMFKVMNYNSIGASRPACAPTDFDFGRFDLQATQVAIKAALDRSRLLIFLPVIRVRISRGSPSMSDAGSMVLH
ncbi:hypothetical protein OBBRIDRAFT_807301 [Obba rivulosa]|uniref:Uncharacterized protein n=1 Tax=Obba rivulosa TaxID=1052685 RepID=A0A8E2AP06_9APHY|nr:hypothetical protein OBBRIDRAFT_807301 [Obba rivulosa]